MFANDKREDYKWIQLRNTDTFIIQLTSELLATLVERKKGYTNVVPEHSDHFNKSFRSWLYIWGNITWESETMFPKNEQGQRHKTCHFPASPGSYCSTGMEPRVHTDRWTRLRTVQEKNISFMYMFTKTLSGLEKKERKKEKEKQPLLTAVELLRRWFAAWASAVFKSPMNSSHFWQ